MPFANLAQMRVTTYSWPFAFAADKNSGADASSALILPPLMMPTGSPIAPRGSPLKPVSPTGKKSAWPHSVNPRLWGRTTHLSKFSRAFGRSIGIAHAAI
eukprot:353893-Pyramimonas_sp.AAC.1